VGGRLLRQGQLRARFGVPRHAGAHRTTRPNDGAPARLSNASRLPNSELVTDALLMAFQRQLTRYRSRQ
jgi:hypothetical protein